MEKNEILGKLTEIFQEIFEDDELEINEATTANDIDNWTSLNNMLLIGKIESEFGIKFKLRQLGTLESVGDFVNAIAENLQ